jgi:hypothetical protein
MEKVRLEKRQEPNKDQGGRSKSNKKQARPEPSPKGVSERLVGLVAQSAAAVLRTTKRDEASTGIQLQKPRWP